MKSPSILYTGVFWINELFGKFRIECEFVFAEDKDIQHTGLPMRCPSKFMQSQLQFGFVPFRAVSSPFLIVSILFFTIQ